NRATPWTPAPSDNYVPPADQPRPANYVPGVKDSHTWDGMARSDRNSRVYYDETSKSLAIYSIRTIASQNALVILTRNWREIPQGPPMRLTAVVELKQDVTNGNQTSSIGVAAPLISTGIPHAAGINYADVTVSLT